MDEISTAVPNGAGFTPTGPNRNRQAKTHIRAVTEGATPIPYDPGATRARTAVTLQKLLEAEARRDEFARKLERLDHIMLGARSVSGLVEMLTDAMSREFEPASAGIALLDGTRMAEDLKDWGSPGLRFMSADSGARETNTVFFTPSEHFQEAPAGAGSAAIAPLSAGADLIGYLCLAAPDAERYREGKDAGALKSLAAKIGLALGNAYEHERALRRAARPEAPDVYSEVFFMEYLRKEMNRSWRSGRVFSLACATWPGWKSEDAEVITELARNVRSADICGRGETTPMWILFPETDSAGALTAVERLRDLTQKRGDIPWIHFGLSEFSRNTPTASALVENARRALRQCGPEKPVVVEKS